MTASIAAATVPSATPRVAERPAAPSPPVVQFSMTLELLVMHTTLAQLQAVVPGQPLTPSAPLMPDALILRVNGSCLGRGSLLVFEQRWALRITQLGSSSESL